MAALNGVNTVVAVGIDGVGVGVVGVVVAAVSSRPSGLLRVFPFTHLTIMEAEVLHTRQHRPQGQCFGVGKGCTR